jgi:hypothetical protein
MEIPKLFKGLFLKLAVNLPTFLFYIDRPEILCRHQQPTVWLFISYVRVKIKRNLENVSNNFIFN